MDKVMIAGVMKESRVDPEDVELFAKARKCQSLKNLQPLEMLSMKAILKNYHQLTSSLKNWDHDSLKTALFEFLLQLTKQGKEIPLGDWEGRMQLVKLLLNKELRYFDFGVLKCPVETDNWELYQTFLAKFDEIWDVLAAKCPKLLKIREMRPIDMSYEHFPALNPKVYTFQKLLCLETNSTIDPGSLKDICENLKHLQRLEALYLFRRLPNVLDLRQLKDLEELQLERVWGPLSEEDAPMDYFNRNYFRELPKLKIYSRPWGFLDPADIKNASPCALEECTINFDYEEDFSRLATCMPNLRFMKIDDYFPSELNPQLLQQFKNLTNLEMPCSRTLLQILTYIGPSLKKLSTYYQVAGKFTEVLRVFVLCPSLERFELTRFKGTVNFEVALVPQLVDMKELALEGDFSKATKFLPLLFSKVPNVEKVILFLSCLSEHDVEALTSSLSAMEIFQNVADFRLGKNDTDSSASDELLVAQMEKLVKHVVSFCPKLVQTLVYGHKFTSDDENTSSSVTPFLDLVNKL